MSFEVRTRNLNDSTKIRHSIFELLDMFIIVLCLLGDKLLNTNFLVYCLSIFLAYRILIKSPDYTFALLISLVPNLAIMFIPIPGSPVPILNILIVLAFFKVIFSYIKKPINKNFLLIIGIFIAYEWFHAVYYGLKSIMLLFSWTFACLYVSLYFINSLKTYNHNLTIKYFITGVFVSIIYGILDFYEKYGTLLTNNATIRFRGGAGDPNYFSMYIMLAMFMMLFLVYQKSNKLLVFLYSSLFVIFVSFGILSLSRMFLLVSVFLSAILVVNIFWNIEKYRRLLFFVCCVLSILVLFSFFFMDEFTSILDLLFSRFLDYIDDPAALTSNRNILAEQYIHLLMTTPEYMIFGMGIQEYYVRSGAIQLEAHNIILEILVVWGLVGFIVFIMYVVTLFKYSSFIGKYLNKNFISWLPIICMGTSYMSINALSNESFFLLLLFSIKNIYEFD